MSSQPLDPPPGDSPVLPLFLRHFCLDAGAPPAALLGAVGAAFSRLPYENLTKILKQAREPNPERARRWPLEVVADHVRLGAGGTCFSLTAALLHIVRALGWEAQPLLADRHYGPNTHCALLVWIDGAPHLLDPGYLLIAPVPLPASGESRFKTPFNEVVLAARDAGRKVDLATVDASGRKQRLTFKAAPADAGEFLAAWDASFDWDMMRYPVLTRVREGAQLYLQGSRLQTRSAAGLARSELPLDELPARIAREFGIDAAVAASAIAVLKRKGDVDGAHR